jgi:hypothetical protein
VFCKGSRASPSAQFNRPFGLRQAVIAIRQNELRPEALDFELPRMAKTSDNLWQRWIDTALDSPHDILQWETAESAPATSIGSRRAPYSCSLCEFDLQQPSLAFRDRLWISKIRSLKINTRRFESV